MKILARSRPHGDSTADSHEWTVEADTYEAARDEARLAVPQGWDLLSVQTLEP